LNLHSHCIPVLLSSIVFFFTDPATTEIYTLSLHDALPISPAEPGASSRSPHERATCSANRWTTSNSTRSTPWCLIPRAPEPKRRSEEHTSELQSRENLVCRLLLEKKKKKTHNNTKTVRDTT